MYAALARPIYSKLPCYNPWWSITHEVSYLKIWIVLEALLLTTLHKCGPLATWALIWVNFDLTQEIMLKIGGGRSFVKLQYEPITLQYSVRFHLCFTMVRSFQNHFYHCTRLHCNCSSRMHKQRFEMFPESFWSWKCMCLLTRPVRIFRSGVQCEVTYPHILISLSNQLPSTN